MTYERIQVTHQPGHRDGDYMIKLWHNEKMAKVIYLTKEEYQWLKQEMSNNE